MNHRRKFWRCRRCAEYSLAALVAATMSACETKRAPAVSRDGGALAASTAPDAGDGQPAKVTWERRYFEGHLAETLRGDLGEARAAYEDVIAGAGTNAPKLAARAALRLAEIEVTEGRRRRAIELVARAASLGRGDNEIVRLADDLQTRLASVRSRGSGVRGPPAETALEGVPAATAARFAKAERLLVAYHKLQLQPRIEAVEAGVKAKERAMESAVRAYRSVATGDERLATTAAEFRVGSLYHDLAIALMFDLPPELEPRAAARLRRRMRQRALDYLAKARVAYARSNTVAAAGTTSPAIERWHGASRRGLASVSDLLRGR